MGALVIGMKETERHENVTANALQRHSERVCDRVDRWAATVLVVAELEPQRRRIQACERVLILGAAGCNDIVADGKSAIGVPCRQLRVRRSAREYGDHGRFLGAGQKLSARKHRVVQMGRDGKRAFCRYRLFAAHIPYEALEPRAVPRSKFLQRGGRP